jgi:ABC-type lipoprotein release transport system permease subunit
VGAAYAARAIQSLLFSVKPGEPAIYAAVLSAMLATAALACAIPAWRGSRISPLEALRYE